MKKIYIIFFVLLYTLPVLAQKKDFTRAEALQRKNSVALTLGGNGLFLSVNYDRILLVKNDNFLDVGVGIGFVPMIGVTAFSHQLVINLGKNTGFLMLGIGGTYEWGKADALAFTETVSSYFFSPIVGWKKMFRNHLQFSIYASPLIFITGNYVHDGWPVVPYGGISFGYRF